MTIQTKNLGLIKAIHVGVNPPLNTKILWFNDSNNPYTTGPAKVHYYYDVILADWKPLVSTSSSSGGNFTYIAFATGCNGEEFNLTFIPEEHCYWAIINSTESIPNLTPELFTGKWTKFCSCNSDSGGSYTYIAFSDNCGENFSEELTYEAPCVECKLVDEFQPVITHPAFTSTINEDNVVVEITNATAGQNISFNIFNGVIPLTDLVVHFIEVVVSSINEPLRLGLGYPGEVIDIPAIPGTYKKKILTLGSKLTLEIPSGVTNPVNAEIQVKVGNKECFDVNESGLCTKCRSHVGILISNTPINELTPELFENKWIPLSSSNCGCDSENSSQDLSNIQNQIEALNTIITDYISSNDSRVTNLENLVVSLQQQINNLENQLTSQINNVENNFVETTDTISEQIVVIGSQVNTNTSNITLLQQQLLESNLNSAIEPFIELKLSEYSVNVLAVELQSLENSLLSQINSVQINVDNLSATLQTEILQVNQRIDFYHPEPGPIE
jgi:hypothetical protein